MDEAELQAWLRLLLTPGVGNESARKLLAAFGSAQSIFEQSEAALLAIGSARLVRAIQTEPEELKGQLSSTLAWLAAGEDRCVVNLGEADYPADLLNITDPPLLLFMLGSLVAKADASVTLDALNCLAIVGSRNPTPQGEVNARQFAQTFGGAGWCVVSGMALGVDGAAHDGALMGGGHTVAVVGTGLDRVYPKKHLALAHRIAERGLIVSEFPLGTPPLTSNFPRRNRLISGLSHGTLVIEAALQSGSLITARLAAEQGKEVFAIPGSIHSPQARGCHLLIKQGAKLVESAQDVLEELQLPLSIATAEASTVDAMTPTETQEDKEENPLLTALGFDATSLDALQARTGWPTAQLQAQLLALELNGEVARLPGGLFVRMASA
ncbi:MAG: DNA-protecting protein DprA [Polaromonas sp.]|nr:DNA-protecting protein DprA [Polaromonas sp.]